jgi:Mg/Co/Ni transporter MgtE
MSFHSVWPDPITYLGLLGGAVATTAVITVLLVDEDSHSRLLFRRRPGEEGNSVPGRLVALTARLAAGTLAGGVFPFLFRNVLALPSRYVTTLPHTLVTGTAYGFLLYLLVVGASFLDDDVDFRGLSDGQVWFIFFAALLYGVVVGAWIGSLWPPLVGR